MNPRDFAFEISDLDVEIKDSPQFWEGITDRAEKFLRAGGSITMSEWAYQSEQTRNALAEAGDRLQAERVTAFFELLMGDSKQRDRDAKISKALDLGLELAGKTRDRRKAR